jgi:hypothetical protein
MLRHSTGYKLANDGHDTRALQHYMGHKNIMHTVRYTEMAPDRFKNFWKDWLGVRDAGQWRYCCTLYTTSCSRTWPTTFRPKSSFGPTSVAGA